MTFRTIAFVALLAALVSVGVYWFVSRPTPQERALKEFFQEFRNGRYDDAEAYTAGKDFYTMAAKTSVRDTNGRQYLIGDYFPEPRREILRASIETYVKPHISRWKYLSLNTEEMDTGCSAVHFRLELGIRDFSSGAILGETHNGRVEGTAHMRLENGKWVVEKFEFSIFSDEGLELATYLRRAQ